MGSGGSKASKVKKGEKKLLSAQNDADILAAVKEGIHYAYAGEDCVVNSLYGLQGSCVDGCKCSGSNKCVNNPHNETPCPSKPAAHRERYGDEYVAGQQGIGGYIPLNFGGYNYGQVQPLQQPQLATGTNSNGMEYGVMLLGLAFFICLALCIIFILLSAVCFVFGKFSNSRRSNEKTHYEELAV